MDKNKHKDKRRARRRAEIRHRVIGTPERPRLSVYKSLNHFYAQVIDDLAGKTLAAASSRVGKKSGGGAAAAKTGNAAAAASVGTKLAEKAKAAGVTKVVFDRGGFKFHGRVKAFADAARKGGLQF
ncbi:MAG: 50S ribosomal protein L18 [Phycisphaeraceae bacterium]|nr:50S ribosomal protein L18 [Phycisphaeraceae bacterium]